MPPRADGLKGQEASRELRARYAARLDQLPAAEESAAVREGRSVPILTSASLLQDETGQTAGALGVIEDLTGKKKLEEEREKESSRKTGIGFLNRFSSPNRPPGKTG